MNEVACEPKQEKHLKLNDSISNIQDVINKLNNLRDRINSTNDVLENSKNCSPEIERIPTLVDMLDAGPDRINENIETMVSVIRDIDGLLFGC